LDTLDRLLQASVPVPIALQALSALRHAWQRTIFWHFLHKTDFSALTEISAGRRWFLDALALE
jgi:hypothetical protein